MPFASVVFLRCLVLKLWTPKFPKLLPWEMPAYNAQYTTRRLRRRPKTAQKRMISLHGVRRAVNDVPLNYGSQIPKTETFGPTHMTFKRKRQKN